MGLGLSAGLSSSTGHEGNSAKLGRQKAQEGWSDLPGRPPKCRLVSHPGSQSHCYLQDKWDLNPSLAH